MGNLPTKKPHFRPFPRYRKDNHWLIDKKKIKEEYDASPHTDPKDFLESRNYRVDLTAFPWRYWRRYKRERLVWDALMNRIEASAAELEPLTLERIVKAINDVPEVLYQLLQICKFQIAGHWKDLQNDALIKSGEKDGAIRIKKPNQELFILSCASEKITKSLYASLGVSADVLRVTTMVQDHMGTRLKDAQEPVPVDEAKTSREIVLQGMNGQTVEVAIKDAFAQYFDPPRPKEELDAESANAPTK